MKTRSILILGFALAAVLLTGCFRGVTSYREPDGRLVYVGEVQNTGDPLIGPDVVATLFDGNGAVIATNHAFVCRPMPTGGTSAFYVAFPPGTPDPARVEWTLGGERVAPGADVGLAVVSGEVVSQAHGEDGLTYVYGEIRNDSDRMYNGGIACVTWLDKDGNLVRLTTALTAGFRLAPGETEPFQAVAQVPDGTAGTRLYLDAFIPRVLPAPGELGYAVTLPDSAFRRTTEYSRATPTGRIGGEVGEVYNNTGSPLLVAVIGTARERDGSLIATSASGPRCHVAAQPGKFTFGSYEYAVDQQALPDADVSVEAIISPKLPLTATGIMRSSPSDGVEQVKFTVKNTHTEVLLVNTCVAAYDRSGNVIGMAESRMPDVAAGASVPFAVDVPVSGDVAKVVVIADGQ